jgi:hypothetical protein
MRDVSKLFMSEKLYYNFKGEIIGRLVGNVYITHRWSFVRYTDAGDEIPHHFYIIGQGYPISVDILDKLYADGCVHINIIEHNVGDNITKYWGTLEQYRNAPKFKYPEYDWQRCVPLKSLKLDGVVAVDIRDNFREVSSIEECNKIDMDVFAFIDYSQTRDKFLFKRRRGK